MAFAISAVCDVTTWRENCPHLALTKLAPFAIKTRAGKCLIFFGEFRPRHPLVCNQGYRLNHRWALASFWRGYIEFPLSTLGVGLADLGRRAGFQLPADLGRILIADCIRLNLIAFQGFAVCVCS